MKVAVSIPGPIFDAAERLARERQVPRSQVFAEALEEYITKKDPALVTAKLDEVYGALSSTVDPALASAQYTDLSDEAW